MNISFSQKDQSSFNSTLFLKISDTIWAKPASSTENLQNCNCHRQCRENSVLHEEKSFFQPNLPEKYSNVYIWYQTILYEASTLTLETSSIKLATSLLAGTSYIRYDTCYDD